MKVQNMTDMYIYFPPLCFVYPLTLAVLASHDSPTRASNKRKGCMALISCHEVQDHKVHCLLCCYQPQEVHRSSGASVEIGIFLHLLRLASFAILSHHLLSSILVFPGLHRSTQSLCLLPFSLVRVTMGASSWVLTYSFILILCLPHKGHTVRRRSYHGGDAVDTRCSFFNGNIMTFSPLLRGQYDCRSLLF